MESKHWSIVLIFWLGVAAATLFSGPLPWSNHNKLANDNQILFLQPTTDETWTVCPNGPPHCDFAIIQDAIDAASSGDVIKIAQGNYTDVNDHASLAQIIYLDKTLIIQGGYPPSFQEPPNPTYYPTVLDAQGNGRGLYIYGDIAPTIAGLNITGGDASTLGGGLSNRDAGGGIYMISATVTLSKNIIFNNQAKSGGGLYMWYGQFTLIGNQITNNTAVHYGGGLTLRYGDATLQGNIISNNQANDGGGLFIQIGNIHSSQNSINNNTAGYGGGLSAYASQINLNENSINTNQAANSGGGLYLSDSGLDLSQNVFSDNYTEHSGGGLYVYGGQGAISENRIACNTANAYGGGLYLMSSGDIQIEANTILQNSAGTSGGGVCLYYQCNISLNNNIIAENQAGDTGSGLYVRGSAPRLQHTTLVNNSGGDGSGIFVIQGGPNASAPVLTNTILISHTVGISIINNNQAFLQATLWGNQSEWDGQGDVITGSHNFWGAPVFADPSAGDYHIRPGSTAQDNGITLAELNSDIDGQPRPYDVGYDLGADEFHPFATIAVLKHATPNPVLAGGQLTYTIHVTNTGDLDLHTTITDVLPEHVTPGGPLTWSPLITAPGGVWSQQVVVTVEPDYAGPLLNVLQAASAEGASAAYTETTQVEALTHSAVAVVKHASPSLAIAGEQLTYTIHVTNTGDVDLNATITDVLPEHVTPDDPLTWTPLITAPGGVWSQQVIVTVEPGYSGSLVNVVQVASEEGASAVYTETSQAEALTHPAVAVVKHASPDPVFAGEELVYTIHVTNTGDIDFVATITDEPSEHTSHRGPLTWQSAIAANGGVWTKQLIVTVDSDYAGPLVNVVYVDTDQGVSAAYTETSQAQIQTSPALDVNQHASPDPVVAGEQLTYTIHVTNTGDMDLHTTITDTLPEHVTPGGPLTWSPLIPASGGVWSQQIVVTVEPDYAGPLNNLLQVSSAEGAANSDVHTSQSVLPGAPALVVNQQASANPLQAGEQLTYTIHVTNTGDVDLNASIVDYMPEHVSPTGMRGWTPVIPAPGGVWSQQVVVTVELGYSGPLTNVLQVSTDQGASGASTSQIAAAGRVITIKAEQGGVIMALGKDGSTHSIQSPPYAVTQTTQLAYTSVLTPEHLMVGFAGGAFTLDAYRQGQCLVGFNFAEPTVVSIQYPDANVAGLDENSLQLYRLDDHAWYVEGITPIEHNTNLNRLVVSINQPSQFAMFAQGEPQMHIYLPVVLR